MKNNCSGFKITLAFLFLLNLQFTISSYAQLGEWTWMNGSAGNASGAVYGTQGVSAPGNTPQGFYEPCEWRDKQGNFWLYGGYNNGNNYSNLWKYDPTLNEWTWVKGPGNTTDENSVHGTIGVPSSTNTPGGRGRGIATWVDTAGNFWLYGGRIIAGQNFSELWEYDIATNEWTWMKGPTTLDANGVYGTQGVPADANHPGGRSETSATWTDAENNLWMFGGYGAGANGNVGVLNDVWKYSIADNQWTWMRGAKNSGNGGNYGTKGVTDTTNNPPARMVFTKWTDEDGNFWIFGGGDWNTEDNYNDVWKYDVAANKWTWMNGPSGVNDNGNVGSQCASDSIYVGPARFENRTCWVHGCNDFWTFSGSINSNVDQNYNDLWQFNPLTLEWTFVEGSTILNQSGSYGTQGVSSPSNQPPSRGGGVSWIDLDGNLWMWGGIDGSIATYNDLWRYVVDPTCPPPPACSLFPVSSFTASDSNVCMFTCLDFSDESLNAPTSWQWIFPGGIPSSSTDQNPTSICYDTAGIYDVTLIVTNANGSDTITHSGFIVVNAQPATPTITQINDTLFASSASLYQWFQNGNMINGATNFYYVPSAVGSYTVEVFDSSSCFAEDSIDFIFYPVSNLSASNTKICQKFCVNYDDQSLYDPVSWQWSFEGAEPSSSTQQNPTNICYNIPGTYDVTLITTNASGVDTIILHDYITVYPTPPFPTITQNGYTLTSSVADFYQWQLNAVDISGATNQTYVVTQTGFFTVVVSDSNGCQNSLTLFVEYTGISDVGDESISIYPNPSSGNFIVESTNLSLGNEFSVEVVNALGQVLYFSKEKNSSANWKKEIDLNGIACGIYFLEIKSSSKILNYKLIITQ